MRIAALICSRCNVLSVIPTRHAGNIRLFWVLGVQLGERYGKYPSFTTGICFYVRVRRQMSGRKRKNTPDQGVTKNLEAAEPKSAVIPGTAAELGSRFAMVLDLYPDRKSAAQAAGKSSDMLLAYTKGENQVPFDVVARLAVQKGVRLDWVATGKGAMRESGDVYHAEGFIYIPRYDVRAGAGTGQLVQGELISDFLAFREDWVRYRLRRNPADLVVIEAIGDSMSPTIDNGDVILVDRSETRIRDSSIYVLLAGDELIVKRVERRLDGSLVVRSDNSTIYAPQEVKPDQVPDLRVIGRVVWAGGVV